MKRYTIDEIKAKAVPIAKMFNIDKLALFGSYARGEEQEDSDLDFLINGDNLQGMFQFCEFINCLEDEFLTHVDVMTYDALKDSFISDSIKDEVILYER